MIKVGMLPLSDLKELQMTTISVCQIARPVRPVVLRVGKATPKRVWTHHDRSGGERSRTPRLPALNVSLLKYSKSRAALRNGSDLPRDLKRLYIGQAFYLPTQGPFQWPPALEDVEFGSQFNGGQLLPGDLPATLKRVKFADIFNTHLGKGLPENLEVLKLGVGYIQSLYGVSWPPGLRQITIGVCFNQRKALPPGVEISYVQKKKRGATNLRGWGYVDGF